MPYLLYTYMSSLGKRGPHRGPAHNNKKSQTLIFARSVRPKPICGLFTYPPQLGLPKKRQVHTSRSRERKCGQTEDAGRNFPDLQVKACHKSGRGIPNLACANLATLTFWDTCQKTARNPHKGFPNLWALIGSPFGKDYTIWGVYEGDP